ncbi:MAG: hypothetical protein I8H80_01085 [Alphaproteobacteria bacterium]|nr:hypothetical protein [Alphaproteobacteria bacterium]
MMNKRYLLLIAALFLTGCGDVQVYDVDTKFSNVIRVEPVSKGRRSVFLRIKDVTGHASELATSLEQHLKTKGYSVVADPGIATYKLMVTIIKFGDDTSNGQIVEESSIRSFADRVGIAEVEITNLSGRSIKTRLMVGVNMRGGLFKAPTPQVEQFAWTRLIHRLSQAVSRMF